MAINKKTIGEASKIENITGNEFIPSTHSTESGAFKINVKDLANYANSQINIDLSLFKVVSELPETTDKDFNPDKIYLIQGEDDLESGASTFTEWAYTELGWDKFGEFKTDIDLTQYVEKEDGKGLFSGNYNDLTNKPNLDLYLLKTNSVQKASSVCSNANEWLTNGYATTSASLPTSNLPSVCTGADRWGVIFYMALNEANKAGFQLYYPIDGTYKGRIFYRSVASQSATSAVNLSFSAWELVPISSDIPSIDGLETTQHASDTYVTKSSLTTKEIVFIKEDGSTETIKSIIEV